MAGGFDDNNDPFNVNPFGGNNGNFNNPNGGHYPNGGYNTPGAYGPSIGNGSTGPGADNMSGFNRDMSNAGNWFQNGWNQWDGTNGQPGTRENLWNKINGSRQPGQLTMNAQAGQTGAGAQAGGPNGANQDQMRGMQMALIQQLQDQASGNGPSLAQMQLQKGTDQNMSQAMALGASQRGAGSAGMLKGIQGQQAGVAQGMAGDAAMLRLQEQMSARQALGQQLGQGRGQDQSWAGMGMQNNQFNAGQLNQMTTGNADRAAAAAKQQAQLDLEREKMLNEQAKQRSPMGAIGGMFSAISDERLKTDIAPGESKLYAFLDKLGAHDYKYKDPKHGEGRRISPMAQELEKSELGREFVFEVKEGKAVDYGKGFGTILAAQAALHKRLKKLGA